MALETDRGKGTLRMEEGGKWRNDYQMAKELVMRLVNKVPVKTGSGSHGQDRCARQNEAAISLG